MRMTMLPVLLLGFVSSAQAHEIWIERDASGPVRIYLGEPAEPIPASGDPEFPRLKSPRLLNEHAAIERQANHLSVMVNGAGDVRLVDDSVFEPWKGDDGNLEGAEFFARAGRSETISRLELEIVPVSPEGDQFRVSSRGSALPGAKLTILAPDRSSKSLSANEQGLFSLPVMGAGRYLVTANHTVNEPRKLGGHTVDRTYLVSTLTVVAP